MVINLNAFDLNSALLSKYTVYNTCDMVGESFVYYRNLQYKISSLNVVQKVKS